MTQTSGPRRGGSKTAPCVFALALSLLGPDAAPGEVAVVVHGDRIDVSAQAAPLSQVIEQIADAIGAEVEYGGSPPAQLVTFAVGDLTPPEMLGRVLEDHNADFALQMDATGKSVVKLVIVTNAATSDEHRPPPAPAPSDQEGPAPPLGEEVLEVMSRLGVEADEAPEGADDSGVDEDAPEAPELPEALRRLLGQSGAAGKAKPAPRPTPREPPGD